jgi:ribonuclease HI
MTIYAHCDGASRGNPGESGIGIIFRDEQGNVIYSGSGYIGKATNNVAEYEALIACLEKTIQLHCKKLIVHSDSELMVRQLQGTYKVKNKHLQKYFLRVHQLMNPHSLSLKLSTWIVNKTVMQTCLQIQASTANGN